MPWLSELLVQQANLAAECALPNEVCGFFVQNDTHIWLHTFSGVSGPSWCSAAPEEVVSFAYLEADGALSVLASFHSHPNGSTRPSLRDEAFAMWTKTHLIWSKQDFLWHSLIFRS